jgi:hypothetical protein
MKHLAQFDFVRPRWPREDPRIAEFYESTAYVNGLAEAHPGFIWRQKDEDTVLAERLWGAGVLYTLSVWKDVESLKHFLYKTPHLGYLKRGREWFFPIDQPRVVLWWIDANHRPTLSEASARLRLLTAHGPSHEAFDLRQAFDAFDLKQSFASQILPL